MRTRVSLCATIFLLLSLFAATEGCSKAPTDAQVSSDIQTKLSADSGLQGKQLAVQADKGTVTLTGVVDNQAERDAASRYASSTPGVKQVVNNIQVESAGDQPAPDQSMQAQDAAPQPMQPPIQAKPEQPTKPSPSVHHKPKATEDSTAAPAVRAPPAANQAENNPPAMNPAAAPSQQAAAPVPAPPPPPQVATVAAGTTLAVRLVDEINTKTAQQGEAFRATLDAPVSVNGEVAIHAGYDVEGHIVAVQSAGQYAGQSMVTLQLDRLTVGDKHYNLDTDQFHRESASRSKNTAEKVGGGAVVGAILGGIFGGGKGAAIGAGAGGAAGGGVQAASKRQEIVLPSETVLNFTLKTPVTVTVIGKARDSDRPKLDNGSNSQ